MFCPPYLPYGIYEILHRNTHTPERGEFPHLNTAFWCFERCMGFPKFHGKNIPVVMIWGSLDTGEVAVKVCGLECLLTHNTLQFNGWSFSHFMTFVLISHARINIRFYSPLCHLTIHAIYFFCRGREDSWARDTNGKRGKESILLGCSSGGSVVETLILSLWLIFLDLPKFGWRACAHVCTINVKCFLCSVFESW